MRLVCPNCDAEYEVDASVIPDSGRDVQCSNCGTAWFQLPPEIEAELEAEEQLYEPPQPAVAHPAPLPESEPEPVPPEHMAPAPPDPMPRRSLDETLLAVLREEAEREQAQRAAEAQPLQTQPDLGLPPPQVAVARRIAKLKGEPEVIPAAAPVVPPKAQTRRELLPEIEEINSSLRASSERRTGQAAAISETLERGKAGGFRSGFTLMLLVAVAGVAVYVMAPKLAAQIPAASGALERYVGAVDEGRVWLDGIMRWAIGELRALTGAA